jgi:hypothetical protein
MTAGAKGKRSASKTTTSKPAATMAADRRPPRDVVRLGRVIVGGIALRCVLLTSVVVAACSSTSNAIGPACRAAGGICGLNWGGVGCIKQAADDAQDCNPTLGPGGARCCLEYSDAAGGLQPPDAGEGDSEAESPDVAATACRFAGGVCALNGGGVGCVEQAPEGAQDCNPTLGPGAIQCCLAYADATGAEPDAEDWSSTGE